MDDKTAIRHPPSRPHPVADEDFTAALPTYGHTVTADVRRAHQDPALWNRPRDPTRSATAPGSIHSAQRLNDGDTQNPLI